MDFAIEAPISILLTYIVNLNQAIAAFGELFFPVTKSMQAAVEKLKILSDSRTD